MKILMDTFLPLSTQKYVPKLIGDRHYLSELSGDILDIIFKIKDT